MRAPDGITIREVRHRRSRGMIELTLDIDVTEVVAGLRRAAAAAARFSASLASLSRRFARRTAVPDHGPRNVAGDGTWQSDLCAAWVHGSCPAASVCDCTCHGGSVR